MSERISLDEAEGVDEYTKQQMSLLVEELNNLQIAYDTRLLASILAGRAGVLYGILIKAGHISQEEAQKIWDFAGEPIKNPPEREVKTMAMVDGQVFDPSKTN